MDFQKPDFVEIRMDAEIGSYQEDDRDGGPLFVKSAAPTDESSAAE